MESPDDFADPLDKCDFQTVARWIVTGPRSILLREGHIGGLWWDKDFQLFENRNSSQSLTSHTVYRPFFCENGLTCSILRRCDFHKSIFETIETDRTVPALQISYRRIEQTHPCYRSNTFDLLETLLSEVRSPQVPNPAAPQAEFVFREVSGWAHGSIHFVESVALQNTLQKWYALVTAVDESAHDEETGLDLIERFETKPLCEPIDLPAADVPFFYRYIDEWRMFFDDDD